MEEQWKDFSTPPYLDPQTYHRRPLPSSSPSSFRSTTLQHFLDGQFRREEEPLPPPSPPALPQTALSLNSGLAFQFLVPHNPNALSSANSGAAHAASFISSAISGPPSPAALFSCCPNTRTPEMQPIAVAADRYHQRMIKNRESAARSRARKQAYTNELELEVSQLKEENARLRKQNEELHLAIGNQSRRRSSRLQRCSTAPF